MIRRILMSIAGLLVLAAAGGMALKMYDDSRFYEGYRPCPPLNAVADAIEPVEGDVNVFGQIMPARYRRQTFSFEGARDERVPAILTLPFDGEPPFPAVVLLHGSHQEKEFVENICAPFNEKGFAMVCFDQYMRGERPVKGNMFTMGRAFRVRCRKTVHETQRLIDYLQSREDIDPHRIYLVGASYGAITGAVATAREKRIRAAALVVGGGNLPLLARAPEVRNELPRWMWPLAGPVLNFVMGVADPVHHAPHTEGTPVLMLNGTRDSVVTPESGEALFAALGEPKEIRWYPVDHPDREPDGRLVVDMLGDGLAWLVEQDAAMAAR